MHFINWDNNWHCHSVAHRYTCITNLDLGVNLLEDEAILDLFVKMPKIGTLVLKVGEKCSSKELPHQRMHIFVNRTALNFNMRF